MSRQFFAINDLEETQLLEAFSHLDYWDSGSNKIYSSPLIGAVSNEKLIQLFIQEVLEDEQHEEYAAISESDAHMLLRQMAMFKIKWGSEKKVQLYSTSEARLAATQLINFIGKPAEFFTNVSSIDLPHDNPGMVMSSDSESQHRSICFFAINKQYVIFIHQRW